MMVFDLEFHAEKKLKLNAFRLLLAPVHDRDGSRTRGLEVLGRRRPHRRLLRTLGLLRLVLFSPTSARNVHLRFGHSGAGNVWPK